MKICPVCQRCYDDKDTVCLKDQTALVGSRPGTRVIADKYRLERLLGRGGMGAVYAATHIDLDRLVAIKLLLSDFTSDADALERFRREARAAARLNHPNVADTFDYGVLPEGGAYIVMELVEGQTLREYMDTIGTVAVAEAAEIGRQVSNGIDAAHRSGTVHRDLKPSNIILTRDHQDQLQAKVVDFGVAKLKEHSTTGGGLTSSGSLIGTPRYMSPEQCSGHKTDERSDIYSIGVILYEMLAGRPPFDAPTATAIAIKHIQQMPPSLKEFRAEIPTELDRLLRQVLDKDPEKRPQSAADFAKKLSEVAAISSLPSESAITENSEKGKSPVPAASVNVSRETNPFPNSENATHRSGQPTFEFSHDKQLKNGDPSVQGYLAPTEIDYAPAMKSSEPPSQQESVVEARSGEATTPKAASTVEMDRPFIPNEGKKGTRRPLLVYAIAAFVVGLIATAIWFSLNRSSREGTNSNMAGADGAASNKSAQATPSSAVTERTTDASNLNGNERDDSQKESLGDARDELKAVLGEWVSSTNARDINRQMDFYAPSLSVFYLKRNISQAAVRAEKTRILSQYPNIEVRVGEPEIQIGAEKETATMRFRKSWSFTGVRAGSGEVIQELRWRKINNVWKITSERDVEVIRVAG
jgi:serine/threonine protein kinase